jgi:uncharacterized protein (TIGR00303 family)
MSDLMLVVIGNTEIATIPGISVAGATPELTKFTPPADVEYVYTGKPLIIDAIPVTPEGHPTPAIITKAGYELADFPILAVRGGSHMAPLIPHVHISDEAGKDFRYDSAVPSAEYIIRRAKFFGIQLEKMGFDEIVIGESTPGGTTTAQAVLKALGYNARTSSAAPENPQNLKEEVINSAFKRVGVEEGAFRGSPVRAIQEFGDPMIATVTGISLGFRKKVVLAGGSQMLAVAACLKELDDISRFIIATTKYVVNDSSCSFKETANEIGVDYWYAKLNFSSSSFKGLRDYETGYVKEGVGAGGSVYLAVKKGFSEKDVVERVEWLYSLLAEKMR